LIAEKERRIADLETDRDQLREDRNRLSQNWQDERDRLLKVIEDAHSTMRLITDQTARPAAPAPRSLFERLVGFGPADRQAGAAQEGAAVDRAGAVPGRDGLQPAAVRLEVLALDQHDGFT